LTHTDLRKRSLSSSEAIADDPKVREALEGLANGSIDPTAPCDAMYQPWTEDEKRRLEKALREIFPERFDRIT